MVALSLFFHSRCLPGRPNAAWTNTYRSHVEACCRVPRGPWTLLDRRYPRQSDACRHHVARRHRWGSDVEKRTKTLRPLATKTPRGQLSRYLRYLGQSVFNSKLARVCLGNSQLVGFARVRRTWIIDWGPCMHDITQPKEMVRGQDVGNKADAPSETR